MDDEAYAKALAEVAEAGGYIGFAVTLRNSKYPDRDRPAMIAKAKELFLLRETEPRP